MGAIRVTPEELESQAREIRSGSEQVQSLIARLMSQVNDLASRWEGAGSSAFQSVFTEWQQGASMTKEGMEGLDRFLTQAANAYRDTDTAIGSAGR